MNGLKTRGVSREVTEAYQYLSTGKPGEAVAIFPRGYKYRSGGWLPGTEKQTWWAAGSERDLFGIHLVPPNYRGDVYLCEGETDAMALAQHNNSLVLALAGEPTTEQWGEWLTYLASLASDDTLYLAFDNDSKGKHYESYVIRHYPHAKQGIVWGETGHKDVCELLMDGGIPQWEPLPRLPPNLYGGETLLNRLRDTPQYAGLTTGFPQLDSLMGKYIPGELFMFTGGTKNGKSSFVIELVKRYIQEHDSPVLIIPLELTITETMHLLAASCIGARVEDIPQQILNDQIAELSHYVYMLEHFGELSPQYLEEAVRAGAQAGAKLVVLDHITAAATSDTEGLSVKHLDPLLYKLKALLNELGLYCLCVTHMNGESTDRATVGTLRGSRALGQVPTAIMGVLLVDEGMTEVYSVTRNRRKGTMGKLYMEFEGGCYTEVPVAQSTKLL